MQNVRDCAMRHKDRGVLPEYYNYLGEALLFALSERLGDQLTPEAALAWGKAYTFISATMISYTAAKKSTSKGSCCLM